MEIREYNDILVDNLQLIADHVKAKLVEEREIADETERYLRNDLANYGQEIGKLRSELEKLKLTYANGKRGNTRLREALDNAEDYIAKQNVEISNLKEDYQAVKSSHKALVGDMDEIADELDYEKNRITHLIRENTELREQIKGIGRNNANVMGLICENDELQSENRRLKQELADVRDSDCEDCDCDCDCCEPDDCTDDCTCQEDCGGRPLMEYMFEQAKLGKQLYKPCGCDITYDCDCDDYERSERPASLYAPNFIIKKFYAKEFNANLDTMMKQIMETPASIFTFDSLPVMPSKEEERQAAQVVCDMLGLTPAERAEVMNEIERS